MFVQCCYVAIATFLARELIRKLDLFFFGGVLSFALVSMLSFVVVVRVTIRASEMFQSSA